MARQALRDFLTNFFPHCGAIFRCASLTRAYLRARSARETYDHESKKARRSRRACTERTLDRIAPRASGFPDLDAPF
jgi:hypothetical protein